MSTHPKNYDKLNDRQSVKTCACLICLGIKAQRQLRNLRQQSIPQTICFHYLYEPNDYLAPAVNTESMNKFMRVLWTAWGARTLSLHAFEIIDSQMRIMCCISASNYKRKLILYNSGFAVVFFFQPCCVVLFFAHTTNYLFYLFMIWTCKFQDLRLHFSFLSAFQVLCRKDTI